MASNSYSKECLETLKLLARSKNVLISGPPGTGKSRLLAEVAHCFENSYGLTPAGGPPTHTITGSIPIPPSAGTGSKDVPAPTKTKRKVFRTVFHQSSKHRDFVSGVTPAVRKTSGEPDFVVVSGTLYRASEYCKHEDGAALLIIDEINRGPAVQVFGGAIVAMESDKRLAPNGTKRLETQYFELLDPITGSIIEYALPHDLYILAAMNQADASVEPLDVAFLRRWEPIRLNPSEETLRSFYGLKAKGNDILPNSPRTVSDVFEASVRALFAVNEQITLGRGPEYQIGHGVLMSDGDISSLDVRGALKLLCIGWSKIIAHIEEVFFGDLRGVAATLNALDDLTTNPYKLIETSFAGNIRYKLDGPSNFDSNNIYPSLISFARE